MSKEWLYSCLIHKTSIVLLLAAVQKPKAHWLLDAKTEAAFCLCRVHLIIRDDSLWLSFSSYQLQVGPAARTHFLFPAQQQSDNWSLSKTDIRPHLGVVVNSSANHDVWGSADWAEVVLVGRFIYVYGKISLSLHWMQPIHTTWFLNVSLYACSVETTEESGASKNRHMFPVFLAVTVGNLSMVEGTVAVPTGRVLLLHVVFNQASRVQPAIFWPRCRL